MSRKPRPPAWVKTQIGQYAQESRNAQSLTTSDTRRSIRSSRPRLSRSTVTSTVTRAASTSAHHGGRPTPITGAERDGGAPPAGSAVGSTALLTTPSRYRGRDLSVILSRLPTPPLRP